MTIEVSKEELEALGLNLLNAHIARARAAWQPDCDPDKAMAPPTLLEANWHKSPPAIMMLPSNIAEAVAKPGEHRDLILGFIKTRLRDDKCTAVFFLVENTILEVNVIPGETQEQTERRFRDVKARAYQQRLAYLPEGRPAISCTVYSKAGTQIYTQILSKTYDLEGEVCSMGHGLDRDGLRGGLIIEPIP